MKLIIIWLTLFVLISFFIFDYKHLQASAQLELRSQNPDSNTGEKLEFPATLYGIRNPETGQIEIKDYEIVGQMNMSESSYPRPTGLTNTVPEKKVDFSAIESPCLDSSVQKSSIPTSAMYVILGKSQEPENITQKSSPFSIEINNLHDESKNDKLTLNLGNDRYKIDPLTVNMICNYSNNSSLNNIITKSVAYENDPSFLHKSCNSFKNTYHKLSGIFDNVNNLTITSEKPHLKILFKKDLLSEEIKGYISDEFKGIGIITVHSVSLSCSFTPFDQLMLLPKER